MPVLILFAYIAIPVLEIATVVWVVGQIGGWWTIAALLGCSLVGAALVSRGGRQAMAALRETAMAMQEAARAAQANQPVPPPRRSDSDLANAGLTFVGGLLLLVPGFLTSLIGLLWVLPITRPLGRRWLTWTMRRRAERYAASMQASRPGAGPADAGQGASSTGGAAGMVVQGDVLSARDSRTTGITETDESDEPDSKGDR